MYKVEQHTVIINHGSTPYNTMKKVLVLMVLVCAALSTPAQGLKWKVGLGIGSIAGSDNDGVESAISYKIGASYELEISESFFIEPALIINNKNFKIKNVSGTIDRYFLEVPVLAAYKLYFDKFTLILNAGPYAAYGLFGSDIEFDGPGTINIFDKDGGYERFEAGIETGAKVAFNSITVGIDFNRALTKCDSNYKQYSQVIGLTLGYRF